MSGSDFVVGLDIGTTKIFTIVATPTIGGELKVLGAGSSPTRGIKKGIVTSIKVASEAIAHSVSEAELSAGVTIREVYAGISGEHIKSHNIREAIVTSRAGDEVDQRDVRKVIDEARLGLEGTERQILHISPQQFILDNQAGIVNPVGMRGVHLEAEVHIVSGAVQTSTNLMKSIESANLKLKELVLEPLAGSYSLFSEDEGSMGAVLIDIGGCLTNVAVFSTGGIKHSFTLPVGAVSATHDIAIGLRTSMEIAEMVMVRYGTCIQEMVEQDEKFVLPDDSSVRKEVEKARLCMVIHARMEEIFEMVRANLEREGLMGNLTAGVVLTGGGSLMDGVDQLAEEVLDMPVRLGSPSGVVGLSHGFSDCRFATGIGLALYARRTAGRELSFSRNGNGIFKGVTGKVKSFFSDFV
jgi:cell division protein FtsA